MVAAFLDGLRVDQRPSGLRVIEEGIEVGRQAERARLMAAQPAAKARALTDAECAAIEAETLQLVRRANATISSGVPYALGLAPVRPTEDPALARQAAAIVASLPKGA